MFSWVKLSHIAQWCDAPAIAANDIPIRNISTDSRKVRPGDLFVALRGPNFDGHDFLAEVAKKGAVAIVSERECALHLPVVRVKDTTQALVKIAATLRGYFQGTTFAITGSAGKSSTKNMTADLLDPRTVRSPASFNNLLGVSQTLFLLEDDTRYLVLEMGMNALGEIRELCENFKPDGGLITNIGDAHIGKLGGKEGIYKAKKELFDFLSCSHRPTSGVALNLDDEMVTRAYQEAFPTPLRTLCYSVLGKSADVQVVRASIDPDSARLTLHLRTGLGDLTAKLPIFGLHHAQNAAAATTAALLLGTTLSELKERLPHLSPADHRGEILEIEGGGTLIDETYNSNPSALTSMLESLAQLNPKKTRLLILGDMRELGDFSEQLHRSVGVRLGDWIAQKNLSYTVVTVGTEMQYFVEGLKSRAPGTPTHSYESVEALKPHVSQWKADFIAVKGSRGIGLDRLLAQWNTTKP